MNRETSTMNLKRAFGRLKVRAKLIILIFAIGSVPLGIAVGVVLNRSGAALAEQRDFAKSALEQEAISKLEGLRDVKRSSIESYLQQIRAQIITFSSQPGIVEAASSFGEAFEKYRDEISATPEQDAKWSASLARYYNDSFGREYKDQNAGRVAPNLRSVEALTPTALALQGQYIADNSHPLGSKDALDSAEDGASYSKLHEQYHPAVRDFLRRFGYYDIFICDPQSGEIVYSVFKELDFATSLVDGPYADTNFGEVFREARDLEDPNGFAFRDFEQYTPSYEAPASFIGSPIYNGEELVGVAIFQMPLDRITAVMSERAGLGETGETYLVHADGTLRSDTFLDSENRNVIDSFRNPEQGHIDSASVARAIRGESGAASIDNYLGTPVLSAFTPVDALGERWALVAEISQGEALAAVSTLEERASSALASVATIGAVASFLGWSAAVLIISLVLSRLIVRPLRRASEVLGKFSTGDLTVVIDNQSQDEFGMLNESVNLACISTRASVTGIREELDNLIASAHAIQKASVSISDAAQNASTQAGTANEASAIVLENVQSVSSATTELEGSIQEISSNAQQVSAEAAGAVGRVQQTHMTVGSLEESSKEIETVVQLIDSVAEQTNLLALNATIEAARAGEAGRGFAVVAGEVKELAKGTSEATAQIAQRVQEIQASVGTSVDSMELVREDIDRISGIQASVAGAVEEQLATVQEMVRSVDAASQQCQNVAQNFDRVSQAATTTFEDATSLVSTADNLGEVSEKLAGLLKRYQVS